jgi:pSer/pThr/pTyr-binding forkhead associated (FHA) protein
MSDLGVNVATLLFIGVVAALTWAIARSMRSQLGSSPPRGAPVLVVTSTGRLQGLEIAVDRAIVAGRGTDVAIHLLDDFASDHHARFEPSGTAIAVVDLGSTNGTFVNDDRIETRTLASPGDTVRIGRTIMEVR